MEHISLIYNEWQSVITGFSWKLPLKETQLYNKLLTVPGRKWRNWMLYDIILVVCFMEECFLHSGSNGKDLPKDMVYQIVCSGKRWLLWKHLLAEYNFQVLFKILWPLRKSAETFVLCLVSESFYQPKMFCPENDRSR